MTINVAIEMQIKPKWQQSPPLVSPSLTLKMTLTLTRDSDSDENELDDDITAITGDIPGTFDDEAPEPKPEDDVEEEVDEILNVPHQPIRAQPARAAKQGVTYSALNVEQHPVHNDCDPRVVGKNIYAMNHSFIQTYSLKASLRKFKDQGMAAALKEIKQQHNQACFVPINYDDLTKTEHVKMMEMVSHMLEKWDKTVKSRNCANGTMQHNWMGKEDTSSPTASIESIFITSVIDASECRKVWTVDIPNAFIQTDCNKDPQGNRIVMVIRNDLVDILCQLDPDVYQDYVTTDPKGNRVIYLHVRKAIYGMLVSSLLFYKKLRTDLEAYGFKVNPYDPCVANKMVDRKQLTICWHVDDLMASHVSAKALQAFCDWLDDEHGNDELGHCKIDKGPKVDFLAIIFDHRVPGQVTIQQFEYL